MLSVEVSEHVCVSAGVRVISQVIYSTMLQKYFQVPFYKIVEWLVLIIHKRWGMNHDFVFNYTNGPARYSFLESLRSNTRARQLPSLLGRWDQERTSSGFFELLWDLGTIEEFGWVLTLFPGLVVSDCYFGAQGRARTRAQPLRFGMATRCQTKPELQTNQSAVLHLCFFR